MTALEDGVVKIGDKLYRTVARRVADFRRDERFKGFMLHTSILEASDEKVLVRAEVKDNHGNIIATGHAEEMRTGRINSTSAVENCETGAVGRALAFTDDKLAGTEIASAEELQRALDQQKEADGMQRLIRHNTAVRNNLESIVFIRSALDNDDYESAVEALEELEREDIEALWMAPTKGGAAWDTVHRSKMKSNEFFHAMKAYRGAEE